MRNRLTNKQKEEVLALLDQGVAYREIARRYGVSLGVVAYARRIRDRGYYQFALDKVIYPGLAAWMQDNDVRYNELSQQLDITPAYLNYILRGQQQPGKKIIDNLLEITGMTYEEAFH